MEKSFKDHGKELVENGYYDPHDEEDWLMKLYYYGLQDGDRKWLLIESWIMRIVFLNLYFKSLDFVHGFMKYY